MYWYSDLLGPKTAVLLLAALLLAGIGLGAWLSRKWRLMLNRRRLSRARRGEQEAPALLEELGYKVVESQARRTVETLVDGEARQSEVIADILASKDGRTCLFEVKTGGQAVDPLHPETRRQLLEYALAFDPAEVFLLDMERESACRVEFPSLKNRPPARPPEKGLWKWLLLALLLGALAGIGIGTRL